MGTISKNERITPLTSKQDEQIERAEYNKKKYGIVIGQLVNYYTKELPNATAPNYAKIARENDKAIESISTPLDVIIGYTSTLTQMSVQETIMKSPKANTPVQKQRLKSLTESLENQTKKVQTAAVTLNSLCTKAGIDTLFDSKAIENLNKGDATKFIQEINKFQKEMMSRADDNHYGKAIDASVDMKKDVEKNATIIGNEITQMTNNSVKGIIKGEKERLSKQGAEHHVNDYAQTADRRYHSMKNDEYSDIPDNDSNDSPDM